MPPPPSHPVAPNARNQRPLVSLCNRLDKEFRERSLSGFVHLLNDFHWEVKTKVPKKSFGAKPVLDELDKIIVFIIDAFKAGNTYMVGEGKTLYCEKLLKSHKQLFPDEGSLDVFYLIILNRVVEGKTSGMGTRYSNLRYKGRRSQRKTRRRRRRI